MLTDPWIIAQLLAQACALLLLLAAARYSIGLLRGWQPASGSERQLLLERRTYLVSALVQIVLVFQVASLVMLLVTANHHLTGIVRGAMCATGSLAANDYGYPALYLKMGGVFLYAAFLMLNYLDNAEPAFPLTPFKYWLVFPALLVVGTDAALLLSYYGGISPNIITTCCSVTFLVDGSGGSALLSEGAALDVAFGALGVGFVAYLGATWARRPLGALLAGLAFVAAGVYTLRHFFVKYIYGLPSHNCLFDIFWPKYHAVGYLIFGAYYALLLAGLFSLLYRWARPHLRAEHPRLLRSLRWVASVSATVALAAPLLYWLTWEGNL